MTDLESQFGLTDYLTKTLFPYVSAKNALICAPDIQFVPSDKEINSQRTPPIHSANKKSPFAHMIDWSPSNGGEVGFYDRLKFTTWIRVSFFESWTSKQGQQAYVLEQ